METYTLIYTYLYKYLQFKMVATSFLQIKYCHARMDS